MGVEMNYLNYIWSLLGVNFKSSLSLRVSFLTQMVFMAINNLVFFSIWWIFFGKFEEVGGWTLNEIEAMYGFAAGAYGLTVLFGGGVTEISRKIIDGELDAYLVQPKSVLLQLLMSRSRASGWGDILTALVLLFMSEYLTWTSWPLIGLLLVLAAAVFVSAGVIIQCLTFWIGPMEHLGRQLYEFVLTFSVYPQTIFPVAIKVVLFTLIPAGFIGFLPVEMVRTSNYTWVLYGVLGATIYLFLAVVIFTSGLRRYESGNRIP